MKIKTISLIIFSFLFLLVIGNVSLEARSFWNIGINLGLPCATAPCYVVERPRYYAPVYARELPGSYERVLVYPTAPVYEQVYVYPYRPAPRFGFGFGFGGRFR